MQPDSELLALKPQWLPNRKGVSTSVFSGAKGDSHHHHSEHDNRNAVNSSSSLRAPPPSSSQRAQHGNNHYSHSSPPPSTSSSSSAAAAAAAAPRSNFFSSSSSRSDPHNAPHNPSHAHQSQRDAAPSWKPSVPPPFSSALVAPAQPHSPPPASASSALASPRALAPAPASYPTRRTEDPHEPFSSTRTHAPADRDSRSDSAGGTQPQPQPQVRVPPAANPPLVDVPRGAASSTWTHGPVSGKPVSALDAGRGASHQRLQSALIDPPPSAAPAPVATGQAVYQKVVFEKEFPSLKDSKHPLGYAPKEAPYKQTFLSSRVTGNWTSKLADAPAAAPVAEAAEAAAAPAPAAPRAAPANGSAHAGALGSRAGPGGGVLGESSSSSSSVLGVVPGGSAGSGAAAAGGAGSAGSTATAGSPSGWGSFAHAAGTSGAGAGGAGTGGAAASGAGNGMSTGKLREQLAVKQSKQLIPVIARKDDGAASGSSRGRQSSLAASGAGGARAGGVTISSKLLSAPAAPAPPVLASGKMLLGSAGSGALSSNGTMMLTKRTAAPLDRPLLMAHSAAAATPSQPQQASVAAAPTPQQDSQRQPQATSSTVPAPEPSLYLQAPTNSSQASRAQEVEFSGAGVVGAAQGLMSAPAAPGAAAQLSQEVLALGQSGHSLPAYCMADAALVVQDMDEASVLQPCAASYPVGNGSLHEAEESDSQSLELAELASYLPGDLLAAPSEQPQYQQGKQQQQQQQAAGGAAPPAPKFLVSSEEEAFLRSLGWTDADDETDDVLSEEEIAAFKASSHARFGAAPAFGGGNVGLPSPARVGVPVQACVPAPARGWSNGAYHCPGFVADVAKGGRAVEFIAQGCGAQATPAGAGAGRMGVDPGLAGGHGALPAGADAAAYAARCARIAAVARSFGSEVSMTDSEDL